MNVKESKKTSSSGVQWSLKRTLDKKNAIATTLSQGGREQKKDKGRGVWESENSKGDFRPTREESRVDERYTTQKRKRSSDWESGWPVAVIREPAATSRKEDRVLAE